MFQKNAQHLQMPLLSRLNELPEKLKEQIEQSWAGTFYEEIPDSQTKLKIRVDSTQKTLDRSLRI